MDEPEPRRPRWVLEFHRTSLHNNDLSLVIRRNGKAFYIDISPSQFVNSPRTTEKYLSYPKVIKGNTSDNDSDTDDAVSEVYETNAIDWAVQAFASFFIELAPVPAPEGVEVRLREHLYPEFFVFRLGMVDEIHCYGLSGSKGRSRPTGARRASCLWTCSTKTSFPRDFPTKRASLTRVSSTEAFRPTASFPSAKTSSMM